MGRMTVAAPVLVVSGPPPRAALDLRRDVFVDEQGVPSELEEDGRDADADHAVVLDDAGRALATARLLDPGHPNGSAGADPGLDRGRDRDPRPTEPAGIIGRVAVRAEARRRGLGRAVTAALERRAAARGLPAVELHAQTAVEGFYATDGYLPISDRFMEAGIEHVSMRKELLPGLRRVRDADGPALARLVGAVWAEYPGCVLDVDAEEPWLRAPGSALAGRVPGGRHAGAMWVVPDPTGAFGGPPGGVAACVAVRGTARSDVVELTSLYVAAAGRRRGWGEGLVRRVEREARARGARRVELWTDSRFAGEHRLYERLGYTSTGATRVPGDPSRTTEYGYFRDLPPTP
jgi:predicted GNAT family N-acyltransferase